MAEEKLKKQSPDKEPIGPIIRKSKEELKEDMRLKKELKAKNAGKIKKIWG